MKTAKKLLALLFALCISIPVGVGAVAANETDTAISPTIITAEEFDAIAAYTTHIGRIMLPRTNAAGTSGNSCGEFVADEANVSFSIVFAPATETYNVQLYHGTIKGGGTPVFLYAKDVPVASGACFSNLVAGETYFFKVSSSDAPLSGSNAKYSYKTFSTAADADIVQ